jgi:hypothetical protein
MKELQIQQQLPRDTEKSLLKAERMIILLKNIGDSQHPGDILQSITLSSELECLSKEITKEHIERKNAMILALGGKVV